MLYLIHEPFNTASCQEYHPLLVECLLIVLPGRLSFGRLQRPKIHVFDNEKSNDYKITLVKTAKMPRPQAEG